MKTLTEPRVQASPFLLVVLFVSSVLTFVNSPRIEAQATDPDKSAPQTISPDGKFDGPKADLRGLGTAFSKNPSFRAIELVGSVSHPYDPKADPTPFVITVEADGATELRIRTSPEEFWEKHPTVGSLGTCSSSRKMTEHEVRLTSLRCSAPVSWALPYATLQVSERTARVQSAMPTESAENQASTAVTLWMGSSSNKPVMSDPVKRYTARQLMIDRVSSLPSTLRYEEAPVGAVPASYLPPTVEIGYSDYREVSGYHIPYRIERVLQDQVESSFQVDKVSIR